MKRTAIRRGTKPLSRKAPLSSRSEAKRPAGQGSGGAVPPRTRVKLVSDRRRRLNRDLAAVVAEKRRAVRYCEAQPLLKAALGHRENTEADRRRYVQALQACQPSRPERPHHMLKRSRGSDATLTDPANIILVCDSCDDGFIEREVLLATRAGLLIPSSARSRHLGRLAALVLP